MSYLAALDLGTTFTAAAVVASGQRPEVVRLGNRDAVVPTLVHFADHRLAIGEAAEALGAGDPAGLARGIKRRFGQREPMLLNGVPHRPEDLMAAVVRSVFAVVTERAEAPPSAVAATHPANWGPYKIDEFASIEVRIETVLTDESPDGSVIEQIPAEGGQIGDEAVITVAESPVIVSLADFTPTDRTRYSVEGIKMDGSRYTNALVFQACRRCTPFVEFNLSRDWRRLRGVLGVSDVADSDLVAVVEITIDGETRFNESATFGNLVEVDLDVTGALRVQIVVDNVAGSGDVGLGSLEVVGGAGAASED